MSALIKMNHTKTKLYLDLLIFMGFLVAMDPHSTGIALHEWLTVVSITAIITHLLLNWDWIAQLTKRFFAMRAWRPRINYILNLLLFVDVVLILYSGIMISEAFVPFLGLHLPIDFNMRRLHDLTANIFVLLLGLHTALHWGWIVHTFQHDILSPLGQILDWRRVQQGSPVKEEV
ncbi:MAG: hypothetical protein Fur0043_23720 [Anaerolineales bacterium]